MTPLTQILQYPHDRNFIGYIELESAQDYSDKLSETLNKMRQSERKVLSALVVYKNNGTSYGWNLYLKRKSVLEVKNLQVNYYLHQIQIILK